MEGVQLLGDWPTRSPDFNIFALRTNEITAPKTVHAISKTFGMTAKKNGEKIPSVNIWTLFHFLATSN